jgi:hypothetical protein
MSDVRVERASAPPVPFSELLPWALFAGLLLLMTLYLVGAEAGADGLVPGASLHAYLHDARHLLGFPCH